MKANSTKSMNQKIVFYDGVCGLCNAFVQFSIKRDYYDKLYFSPLQGQMASSNLPATDLLDLNSVVFLDGKETFRKSTAVLKVMENLSTRWRILSLILMLFPRSIRDLGYDLVANYRYKIWGKSAACLLPSPEQRRRFLE
jgi:predicted DCC family thiol-disulfide oxidoreductase YuxK